jgi:lysophospholipase L1-like esterase
MKQVLCFGDSNTWGWIPGTGGRFPREARWPGVMAAALGAEYAVIEEGLNGRTTVFDDATRDYRNGRHYLVPCLESHHPLDLVIVFLGVNDLKARFGLSAVDIADGAALLLRLIRSSESGAAGKAPPVLLVSPPLAGPFTDYAELFTGAAEKSRGLSAAYKRVADELGAAFFDAATLIVSSDRDGIHLEAGEHAKLGRALADHVRAQIG